MPRAPAQDVVGVFDDKYAQVFVGARPLKATVMQGAKMMEHPVETGAIITDHRIILPIEIQLSMIFDGRTYRDVYAQVYQLFINSTMLTVQTKTARYPRMIIQAIPHDETADMYDTIAMAITLKEVVVVRAKFGALRVNGVKNPTNSSTQKTGQKQPISAAADTVDFVKEKLKAFGGG